VDRGRHFERRRSDRAEIRIGVQDRRQQRRLQNLLEPVATNSGRTEYPLELRVQRLKVEQPLVDIEKR
jgi:hypothetical protein